MTKNVLGITASVVNPHFQTPTGTLKPVYTDAHWFKAAYGYLLYGSMKKAAKEAGVPYGTVKAWKKNKPDRWNFFVEQAQMKMLDKTVGALNAILKKACANIEKTLDEGEQRVTKDGEIVHVRPPLAAQNAVMGTVLDKLHRIHGSSPEKREKPDQKAPRDLMQELGNLGRQKEEKSQVH